jgi:hypothetical protein
MVERVRAGALLGKARELFDAPGNSLAQSAADAWKSGFASGGQWMRRGLECLRGTPCPGPARGLNTLGLIKYGLACLGALACLAGVLVVGQPLLLLLSVPVFYAIEAQMVFLFPLVFDGSEHPFRDSRRWTRRAGGTGAVMWVVLPIACTMLLGGFAGRGFVRSWCLGCLAVCVWYEVLRTERDG